METEILLLKRKLFFNEVEETDNPIQRNVIYEQVGGKRRVWLQFKLKILIWPDYVYTIHIICKFLQAKQAIIKGKHPVTEDVAVQFAALQVQIQFGDHKDALHRPGFLSKK